jgi:16S rRNA (cytosine1402-N4)-methyltransferase
MEYNHTPVMLEETLAFLALREGGIYIDGTLGGGGHAAGICGRLGRGGVFAGIDLDRDAMRAAETRLAGFPCEKIFIQGNYADAKEELKARGIERVDGALLDLGVSSFQLDNAKRGFSYMRDGPLDMRMDAESALTAADVVNRWSGEELTRIFRRYGEERWAARISAFIVKKRAAKLFTTTGELAETIKAAVPAAAVKDGGHPAKRCFQAIRIAVNDELAGLETAADDFIDLLSPGGRLCVITFHSLEDRIVKKTFFRRESPCACPVEFPVCVCGKTSDGKRVTKKPVLPSAEESRRNPRARSAKLRAFEKKDIF